MKKILCPACALDQHTEPQEASLQAICTCGERTCGCYGVQVRAGVRDERAPTLRSAA